MLRCLAAVINLVSILVACGGTAAAFPVAAYLQSDSAPVRSGPGNEFYETQLLRAGEAVEIYKTTSDGWCAIRPPEGSFSWVEAAALENGASPSVMKVARPGVRTRVGSLVGDDRNVKYVTLQLGEAVRTLGHSTDGDWIKISPPSGEFRWIHRKYLGSHKPDSNGISKNEQPRGTKPSATELPPATLKQNGSNESPHADQTDSVTPASAEQRDVFPQPGDPRLSSISRPLGEAAQMATVPIEDESSDDQVVTTVPEQNEQLAGNSAWKPRADEPTFANVTNSSEGDSDFGDELRQINLALSSTVVQETSQWDLIPIRQRAERVIDTASRSVDRDQARQMLRRIAEFEDVQRRFGLAATDSAVRNRPKPTEGSRSRSISDSPDAVQLVAFLETNNRSEQRSAKQSDHNDEGNGKIVGKGWLMPVITSNPGLPKYALTDEQGQIEYFVSPGSDVRLKSFLRQRVAVTGHTRFVASLGKSHLSATTVVPLR